MRTTFRKIFFATLVAGALALPMAGASAAPVKDTKDSACTNPDVFDPSFAFVACAGGYDKNVLDNSATSVATQKAALAGLDFDTTGFRFDDFFKIDSLKGGAVELPLGDMMFGDTIFGVHFGGGSVLGNVTVFYRFDAGSGTSRIPFATNGSSGFVLYRTSASASASDDPVPEVPEPATWAMLIAGAGLVGMKMRRRSRRKIRARV